MKNKTFRHLTSSACVWALIAGGTMGAPALAQAPAPAEVVQSYDLPAQDLNQALLQFAQTAGLQVFYDNALVDGRRSAALNGRYTPRQALTRLLSGTGLSYAISGNTVRLSPAQADGGDMNLGTIRVQGGGVAGEAGEAGTPLAYEMGDAIDTGTSISTREAIEARQNGNGDVNQTLKILPHVYFSNNEGRAISADIQDIRPSELSIAGSQPYENSFILDGIAANSRLDTVSNNTAADFQDTVGASAETLWLDSSLIDSVTMRDSNVSARYGGFTGGVVEIDSRAPGKSYGTTLYRSCTSDELVHFKIDDATRANLTTLPQSPEYTKCRTGLTLDLPINERLRVLIGASQQQAELTYYKNATYGGTPFGQKSESRNLMVKAEADLPRGMTLTAQYTYSPYEQEYSRANAVNDLVVSHGGGRSAKLGLKGNAGDARWSMDLNYIRSDTSRTAPTTFNFWPVEIIGPGICSSAACSYGGTGDIDQLQTDINLKGDWAQPLWGGTLRGGFDFGHTEVEKGRPEQNGSAKLYTSPRDDLLVFRNRANFLGANVVCAAGDDLCVAGKGFMNENTLYPAYHLSIKTQSYGLWGEYSLTRGNLGLRAGLRYDRESILDNDNFAPRFTVSYDFPWVTATFGANRYYHQSFLGYAINAAQPQNLTYRRTSSLVNGQRVANPWYLYDIGVGANLYGIGLKTPYSDELTLAFSRQLFGGQSRLKFIRRDYADQVTRNPVNEIRSYQTPDGKTSTYRVNSPENKGESTYEGLSIEWGRAFGRHTVTFSGNWAETKTNISATNAYMSAPDDYDAADLVYYGGEVRSLMEVMSENQRLDFASPGLANADWSAHWLDGRLRTNLNARWRAAFEQVADTNRNITVGGRSYDVYDIVQYDSTVTLNGGLDAQIVKRGRNVVTLEIKGTNLLDTLPHTNSASTTAQPYRFGRSFWVGIKYKY